MRWSSVSLAVALWWLGPVAPGLPAQTRPPLRELLPETTLAYLEAKDLPTLVRAVVHRSPLGSMLRDPEVETFLEPLHARLLDAQRALTSFLGIRPIELGRAFGGPAAVALVDRPEPGGVPMPDVVVALGIAPGETAIARVLDHLGRRSAETSDISFETATLVRRSVAVFSGNGRFEVCACIHHETLFVTTGRAAMQRVLGRLDRHPDAAGSLAASQRFRQAAGHAHAASAHAFFYLDLESVWPVFDRVLGRGYPEYDLAMRVLDLRKIHNAAWSLWVSRTGFRERAYVGGKGNAIRALLGRPGLGAPSGIPGNALLYVGYRVNWVALYAGLKAALEGAARSLQSESAAEWLGVLRLLEEGAFDLDVREDLVGALGPELALAVVLPRGGSVPRLVVEVEVRAPSRLERVLNRVRALAPSARVRLTLVSHGDHRLHVFRFPGRPLMPTIVLDGNRLVFGSTPTAVKEWLGRPISLADHRGYRLARTAAGLDESSTAYSVTYLDVPRLAALLLDNLGPVLGRHGRRPVPLPFGAGSLDPVALPATATITAWLTPLFVATRPLGDGLVMEASTPVPLLGGLVFSLEGTLFTGTTRFVRPPGELGVYLDDQYTGVGCRLSGVDPDSAAARAGLEAGDVIVEINGKAVRNADAAVTRLSGLAARQSVRLLVQRGTKPKRAVEVLLDVRRDS